MKYLVLVVAALILQPSLSASQTLKSFFTIPDPLPVDLDILDFVDPKKHIQGEIVSLDFKPLLEMKEGDPPVSFTLELFGVVQKNFQFKARRPVSKESFAFGGEFYTGSLSLIIRKATESEEKEYSLYGSFRLDGRYIELIGIRDSFVLLREVDRTQYP